MSTEQRPRSLTITSANSGAGKTTLTTAILRALVRRGLSVGGAKVGPDYIDPTYHTLATAVPSYNLDPMLSGGELGVHTSLSRGFLHQSLTIIEGVMGYLDGTYLDPLSPQQDRSRDPKIPYASTAHIAGVAGSGIVIVIDARATSATAPAIAHGVASYATNSNVVGVIVNRVKSPSHEEALRRAFTHFELPVFGYVPQDSASLESRHLGLIPANENPNMATEQVERLADLAERSIDLDALVSCAQPYVGPPLPHLSHLRPSSPSPKTIGVASGAAYTFFYQENLDILREQGAEIRFFDPMVDTELPQGISGLILGGGFPEIYAEKITSNDSLKGEIARFIRSGGPTWAECGGHMLLGQSIGGHLGVGVLEHRTEMTSRLHLGYKRVRALHSNVLFSQDTEVRGHEFHYSHAVPPGAALRVTSTTNTVTGGYGSPSLLSSYLHFHLGGIPDGARRFIYGTN